MRLTEPPALGFLLWHATAMCCCMPLHRRLREAAVVTPNRPKSPELVWLELHMGVGSYRLGLLAIGLTRGLALG